MLTGQFVAQELIRSAVGTIGLIAAVPVTTALAAYLAARHGTTTADPPQQHTAVAITTGTPPSAGAEPAPADPWMAFVDRHPDNRDQSTPTDPGAHRARGAGPPSSPTVGS